MGFVRGLVFGKAHITVNAKYLKTVYAVVLVELIFQGFAKLLYFCFQGLKLRFMLLKPLSIVVLGELLKKPK
jgi:hypothetical protein